MDRPADWPCPNTSCVNHTKMVFGTKTSCPKCGSARDDFGSGEPGEPLVAEKGMQGGDMPNDWQCPNTNCMNHEKMVFGKHISCPSCGTARNAKQAGDWICPNVSCVNNRNTVFASKTQCPRCGTPKPMVGTPRPSQAMHFQSMPMQLYQHSRPSQFGRGVHTAHMMMMMQQQQQQPMVSFRSGAPLTNDWQCPNRDCINHQKMVFGKNDFCPKCGSKKPSLAAQQRGNMGRRGGGSNPGDWKCPNQDCLNHRNHVFAKHSSCPSCGSERPDFDRRSRSRSRSPISSRR